MWNETLKSDTTLMKYLDDVGQFVTKNQVKNYSNRRDDVITHIIDQAVRLAFNLGTAKFSTHDAATKCRLALLTSSDAQNYIGEKADIFVKEKRTEDKSKSESTVLVSMAEDESPEDVSPEGSHHIIHLKLVAIYILLQLKGTIPPHLSCWASTKN